MNKLNLVVISIMLCTLMSCASIVSKSKWPLSINSNPSGAFITITNRMGVEVYKGSTPATVMLASGSTYFKKELYKIHFKMAGYDDHDAIVECHVNGWYWGNLIFGGAIGMLIVDPATGAMYALDREVIIETMSKSTASTTSERKLNVYSLNDLPQEFRTHLIKIN
ncbi:MAG: hypothetical protein JSS79_07765 [Bacteroidetes bacterium]|nr:hypothetical protein [Bacteroidota bacterium]